MLISNRKSLAALFAGALILGLSACGQQQSLDLSADTVKETTVYARSDGSLDVAYMESFTESYYSKNELAEYAASVAKEYNQEHNSAISVEGVNVADGSAVLIMRFDDAEVFADFDKGDTISYRLFSENDAHAEFDDLRFEPSGKKGSKSLIFGNEVIDKNHMVAEVDGAVLLQTEGKIAYYSGGELIDEHHIRSFENETTVVIYKK